MTKIVALFLSTLLLVACSADEEVPSSGNAFCDAYGVKLQDLNCSMQPYGAAAASACALVIAGETKCPAEYKAILTCQTTTSSCGSDGSLVFGPCEAQSEAYSQCLAK